MVGYSWMEFRQNDHTGENKFLTIKGCLNKGKCTEIADKFECKIVLLTFEEQHNVVILSPIMMK